MLEFICREYEVHVYVDVYAFERKKQEHENLSLKGISQSMHCPIFLNLSQLKVAIQILLRIDYFLEFLIGLVFEFKFNRSPKTKRSTSINHIKNIFDICMDSLIHLSHKIL